MTGRITILGCGSSGGVPRIGQGWGACDPAEPRNRRLRCSILIERTERSGGTTSVLVDTSPDLRQQLLATGTGRLDAIVFTHPHADHTHGIDDVRPLVLHMQSRIVAYMDDRTAADIRGKFSYVFETAAGSLYPPLLDSGRLEAGRMIEVDGPGGPIRITGFELEHGEINALGLRVGRVAYTPDLNRIPDASLPFLDDLDLWIVDALRYKPHPSHFSLEEALHWVARCKPKRAVLTNLHNDLDYATLSSSLPEAIEVAYDGMVLSFDP
jgi:phosphoribosyl 1,2-cyclic phosphate phosphodiesterase